MSLANDSGHFKHQLFCTTTLKNPQNGVFLETAFLASTLLEIAISTGLPRFSLFSRSKYQEIEHIMDYKFQSPFSHGWPGLF